LAMIMMLQTRAANVHPCMPLLQRLLLPHGHPPVPRTRRRSPPATARIAGAVTSRSAEAPFAPKMSHG
jgi:hypothetical protein